MADAAGAPLLSVRSIASQSSASRRGGSGTTAPSDRSPGVAARWTMLWVISTVSWTPLGARESAPADLWTSASSLSSSRSYWTPLWSPVPWEAL